MHVGLHLAGDGSENGAIAQAFFGKRQRLARLFELRFREPHLGTRVARRPFSGLKILLGNPARSLHQAGPLEFAVGMLDCDPGPLDGRLRYGHRRLRLLLVESILSVIQPCQNLAARDGFAFARRRLDQPPRLLCFHIDLDGRKQRAGDGDYGFHAAPFGLYCRDFRRAGRGGRRSGRAGIAPTACRAGQSNDDQ